LTENLCWDLNVDSMLGY